jgi:HD-like signal output (HDOD) protein
MVLAPVGEAAREISAWVEFISKAEIPVLKQTAREVGRLKEDEDNQSARTITAAVINDPMMVFKVLCYSQQHKGRNQLQDLLQVEQAVLMMGATAFFNNIPVNFLVEDALKTNLPALTHLLRAVRRAHRAAFFAVEWAIHLQDLHSEEVRIAALLHDLADLLMWCFQPEKMNNICVIQQENKALRSKAVQLEVLGFTLHDLQKELVEAFAFPPLLSKLMQDSAAGEQRVRNVQLAVNFARHSAHGWDDAALPDDYRDIAELLRMDVDRVMRLVGVPTLVP